MKTLHSEDGQILAQVAQRCCAVSIPGDIENTVARDSG